jgi:hypothetical protein
MATTTYRYLFADLLTNQILAELPLTGVTFTQALNAAGSFSGHLLLSGIDATGLNVDAGTTPGRTALYVDRNGVLVWGGIIWNREYNSTSQTLNFRALEFLSYFERRRITATIAYTNTDQLAIAQGVMVTAAGATAGNIGLLYNQDPGSTIISGILISRTYYGYELKTVLSAIQDLAKSTTGFDFEISVYYDGNGNPAKSFNTYYPRTQGIYSSSSTTAPVFELPSGNIAEYTYPEDGSLAANTLYVLGAGSNEGKLLITANSTTTLGAGWPLLEEAANYSDINNATVLSNLAVGQISAIQTPPVTLKITAPPNQNPEFGTYAIGDDVRVRLLDNRFPTGLDSIYRLIALSVQAGEDGPERVILTLTTGTY